MATTKKTTVKKTTKSEAGFKAAPVRKAVSATTKVTAPKKQYAYIFFNCNEEKHTATMNVEYNNEVFADTVDGRKALLTKVEEEVSAGRVNIEDKKTVKELILKGEPSEASNKLQYGCIERLVFVA